MSRRSRKSAEIQKAIGKVLLYDWDPIGVSDTVAAHDEYESYVGGVYRLLASGASEYQIIRHLGQLETVSMGFSTPNAEHLKIVAKKLVELEVH